MFQGVQLLLCDWLLTTRTEIWEQEIGRQHSDTSQIANTTASKTDQLAFQQDLCCLRKVSQHLKAALPRVGCYDCMY